MVFGERRLKAELKTRIDELSAAVRRGGLAAASQLAHRVKGGSENIGASHVGALCSALKEAADRADAARAGALVTELEQRGAETGRRIERMLAAVHA